MPKCEKCWGSGEKVDHCELGRRARVMRVSGNLSLQEQAHRLGITPSHLCYLEQGKRGWSEELWKKAMIL